MLHVPCCFPASFVRKCNNSYRFFAHQWITHEIKSNMTNVALDDIQGHTKGMIDPSKFLSTAAAADKPTKTASFATRIWPSIKHIVLHMATVPKDVDKIACSSLTLNCFDPFRFLFFVVGTVIVPYFIYLLVAKKENWTERNIRSRTNHYETVVSAIFYVTTLWLLGNYRNTFDWVGFLAVTTSCLVFGKISELSWAKESLVTISRWDGKMWALIISVLVIIIALAIYHIYLSVKIGNRFWISYVGALTVPAMLLGFAYLAAKDQNNDPSEKDQVLVHLHHYQIFFVLALFTRFPNLVSRICGGITIGCMMQGFASYGPGTSFSEKPKPKITRRT